MVEVKTSVSCRNGDEIVSADINLYNDKNVLVRKVRITDEDDFKALVEKINKLDKEFCDKEQVKQVLKNDNLKYDINARTLNGKHEGDFMLKKELPDVSDKCDKYHASPVSEHGVGDKLKYGHVRIVEDVDSETFKPGEALAASVIKRINNELYLKAEKKTLNGGYLLKIGRVRDNKIDGLDGSQLMLRSGDAVVIRLYSESNTFFEKNSLDGKRYAFIELDTVYRLELNMQQGINSKGEKITYLEGKLAIRRTDVGRKKLTAWCRRGVEKTLEQDIIERKVVLLNGAAW